MPTDHTTSATVPTTVAGDSEPDTATLVWGLTVISFLAVILIVMIMVSTVLVVKVYRGQLAIMYVTPIWVVACTMTSIIYIYTVNLEIFAVEIFS